MPLAYIALRNRPSGSTPMTWHRLEAAILDSLRMNRSIVLVMAGYVLAAFALGKWA